MKAKRFQELDALRGIAALMVVLFHYTMGRDEASLGFKLGTTGVDMFFMISGFVILLSLDNIQKSGQFIVNRISRLYPTYWASVTVTFLLVILSMDFSEVDVLQYIGNMSMFQFYLNIPDLDGPYWTMIIEMLFYILMVLLFHFKLLNHLLKIGVVLTIVIVMAVHFQFENFWVQEIFKQIPLLQFWPLFFAGILFYKIITSNSNKIKYYGVVALCLVSQIFLFEYSGRSKSYISIDEYALMLVLFFSLFTLFVNGKLKFIINMPSLFLGKISFALYLIHQMLSIDIIIPYLVDTLDFNFWLASAIALLCTLVLATCITFFIEVPYSRKLRNKLSALIKKQ